MILAASSAYRRAAVERANLRYDAFLAQGFPTPDFAGQPEPETLQCRNELDRTNWLGLLAKCTEAQRIATDADNPDIMQMVATELRCTSNRMYPVTFADARARMLALLSLVDAAQQNWWRLKDLCRDLATRQEVLAINMDEGWP